MKKKLNYKYVQTNHCKNIIPSEYTLEWTLYISYWKSFLLQISN